MCGGEFCMMQCGRKMFLVRCGVMKCVWCRLCDVVWCEVMM